MRPVTQRGFEDCPNSSPKNNQPLLRVGRVISVNQAQNTCTVAMMGGEGVLFNVPVIGGVSSTLGGTNYLPKPIKKSETDSEPIARNKRDLFVVVGFVNGSGTMPVIMGFKQPEVHQLSFDGAGFENHKIERHDSDKYTRIIGDAAAGVPCEEETYWPDGSYFKVWDGSSGLTDLAGKNKDNAAQPFKVKADDPAKGFYFKHSSGTEVFITKTGEVHIKNSTKVVMETPVLEITGEDGGTCAIAITGNIQQTGSINSSGSIVDGGGNTNHHAH